VAAARRKAAMREAMLSGPVLPTLLRLALPTVTVLVAQTGVNIAEAYYVGLLGTDALAGVALVFPVFMLMTMMSGDGLGSGVASAVARAIGADRQDNADALVLHAVVLAAIVGAVFTAGTVAFGPALYGSLGGEKGALGAALLYSNWLFAGAIPLWIVNLLAAALRGAGNVRLPALVTLPGAIILVPFSPLLIFGLGPCQAWVSRARALLLPSITSARLPRRGCGADPYHNDRHGRPGAAPGPPAAPALPGYSEGWAANRLQHCDDQPDGDPYHRRLRAF
jgi:Na+-driven multidrug efflux pump